MVEVPYIALDNFAYDITGRLYYQVLDLQGRSVSGYEDLPGPAESVELTRDYPALARFYNDQYRGAGVRLVSLMQPISGGPTPGMAEIRVAETLEARDRMAHTRCAPCAVCVKRSRREPVMICDPSVPKACSVK